MALQIFTASLLKEGHVVYLCLEGNAASWSTDLVKATTSNQVTLEQLQIAADRSERENMIIAPYAVDVELENSEIIPVTKREKIRASGPTVAIPVSVQFQDNIQNSYAA
ncbi:MAG: DUF2849 domain-containing protein [Sneathiella sp.]